MMSKTAPRVRSARRGPEPSSTVTWQHQGQHVQLSFKDAPRSVSYIEEADVIVVVEAIHDGASTSNAVVYNLDGTERLRLQPPAAPEPLGFDRVFQSRAGATAVVATRKADVRGRPNFSTGLLEGVGEWR